MLFGPITLVMDVSPANQLTGVALTGLCLCAFVLAICKPRPWPIALAILAVLLWLFAGLIGEGINC
jgi:hypothetical protein